MALTITHTFVSAKSDGADSSLVRPSDWNASHTLAGTASIAQGGTNSGAALNSNRLVITSNGAIVEASAITATQIIIADSNGLPSGNPLLKYTEDANGKFITVGDTSGNDLGWRMGTDKFGDAHLTAANKTIGSSTGIYITSDTSQIYYVAGVSSNWDWVVAGVATKLRLNGTAGQGFTLTAGTAVTDVAAFSLTRTNNDASVATGVKWTFTDTSSAAGFKPFEILGGSSGTTSLFSVDKSGTITIPNTKGLSLDGAGTLNLANVGGYLVVQSLSGGNGTAFSASGGDASNGWFGFNGTRINMASGEIFGWTSGTDIRPGLNAADTAITRISAGVIGVGNGTSGDYTGTIKLTLLNVASGGSTTISTGVGSVKMSSANAATNTVWIPFQYAGTTYYVPGWTTNSP